MERSENEIVAAPPFSTVQVKPPRFFARMLSNRWESPASRSVPFVQSVSTTFPLRSKNLSRSHSSGHLWSWCFCGPFDIEIVSARPRCPVRQNGQAAGRRGTQIFLKRTIVFALLDGVLLAFDLRELVYRAAGDQQSSGDTNDEQGVSLRNFWRGGR